MIPLNVKSPLVQETSAIPMMIAVATTSKLVESVKFTFDSIQIFAPRIPIIPKRATCAPPRTPPGIALRTAPNFGDTDKMIAPKAAIQYAAVE
mgnify:CR=1 FL=1